MPYSNQASVPQVLRLHAAATKASTHSYNINNVAHGRQFEKTKASMHSYNINNVAHGRQFEKTKKVKRKTTN